MHARVFEHIVLGKHRLLPQFSVLLYMQGSGQPR
jgi:hypothetical protein